ncbi:Glutathione S-transferase III [Taphrina deformans PYCC 5710]|uniref:Glutathione S-transferase III n=1 Tax=Taphrina deformans (strain PYCC 5710 / ATCC 11124 / CBS 356.35 / IMI 108563 / JCM 9778 / NBRC 8474) TaxID=1097556 RepID=R4XFR9_TAPDE|nr:Glutathione S-transferase III [Taphrina deformans PYCC 5710]|eukprot:CCG83332.1 Glutathione S-transferase III [Taphrina deformans PYCC 5710]
MGIVIHHLENSRSFRVVWLLNELEMPYELRTYPRLDNRAPPDFKRLNALGKAPVLEDGGKQVLESGNIVAYLLEAAGRPSTQEERMWSYYAEGTLLLHALAITYARWSLRDPAQAEALQSCEAFMSANVQNDLNYVESQLPDGDGELFLVGTRLSAADIMMAFSVEFTLKKKLGTQGKRWPKLERWLAQLERRPAYIKARKEAPHEL